MDTPYRVESRRLTLKGTGIKVRALTYHGDTIDADIAWLDLDSLLTWLSGLYPSARSAIIASLLGHDFTTARMRAQSIDDEHEPKEGAA